MTNSGFNFSWTHDGFPFFESCVSYLLQNARRSKFQFLNIIDSLSSDNIALLRQNKKNVILTNNVLRSALPEANQILRFQNSFYGMYAGTPEVIVRPPIKSFNCFINRMAPTRQSWAYQLIRRNLFDHGYISFNMDISRHITGNQCRPTDTPMDVFEQQFRDHCAIFVAEHEILKSIVPYKNFQSNLLSQVAIDSKFSIVIETYLHDNRFITYSEKIFRCLKLPRPWVLHAQQGAIACLRTMGFDTLDDIVDHSYDQIEFTIDRQVAILDQCEKLMLLDLDKYNSRLSEAAIHNCELLNAFYNNWHKDIDQTFLQAAKLITK